jgi:hypothetical protein
MHTYEVNIDDRDIHPNTTNCCTSDSRAKRLQTAPQISPLVQTLNFTMHIIHIVDIILKLTRSVESPSSSTVPNAHNCRILKTTFVKELTVISAPTKEADLILPPINTAQVRMREQQAVHRAQIDASRIGVGVTQEAQDIFNSLCKTYAYLPPLYPFFFSQSCLSFFSTPANCTRSVVRNLMHRALRGSYPHFCNALPP